MRLSKRMDTIGTFVWALNVHIIFLAFFVNVIPDLSAQVLFNSIDLQNDTQSRSMAGGWGVLNNDGFLDLYVSNHTLQTNFLYFNIGGGFQMPVFSGSPVEDSRTDHKNKSQGIGLGDYDNDMFLDIFVANSFQDSDTDGNNSLFRSLGNELFSAIDGGQPIMNDGKDSFGGSWGDYDNDGFLDLYVVNGSTYQGSFLTANFLYHNEHNGTFSIVTLPPVSTEIARSRCANWVDYDNDGDLDLFVANWFENHLFKNLGPPSYDFELITVGEIVTDQDNSITSSWGDYDNDGDLDLFVGNHEGQDNCIYRNNGDGTLTKLTVDILEQLYPMQGILLVAVGEILTMTATWIFSWQMMIFREISYI